MNGNILVIAAASIGLIAGSGLTYVLMPQPEPVVRAPTEAEIAALVAANPSLLPEPQVRELEVPTHEEALAAYREAYRRNPLRTGRGELDVTLVLGDCDKNPAAPGITCIASIRTKPNSAAFDRVIAFAKGPSGEWIALNY